MFLFSSTLLEIHQRQLATSVVLRSIRVAAEATREGGPPTLSLGTAQQQRWAGEKKLADTIFSSGPNCFPATKEVYFVVRKHISH